MFARTSLRLPQLLEDRSEPAPRPMKAPRAVTRRQPRTAAICAGERPSHSARSRTSRSHGREQTKRFVHERLLRRLLLRRASCLFGRQSLVQRLPAAARTPLVREHAPGRAYSQTRAASPSGTSSRRRHAMRKTSAGSILRIARRTGAPAAVRDDVRAVRGEQRIEPALPLARAHTRPPHGTNQTISATPRPCPAGPGSLELL